MASHVEEDDNEIESTWPRHPPDRRAPPCSRHGAGEEWSPHTPSRVFQLRPLGARD